MTKRVGLPLSLKRLHPDNFRIARAAGCLLLLTVAANLASAAREIAIAWRFGRGVEVDVYNLAYTLTLWLPLTVYSIMTVVIVPTLVKLRRGSSGERALFVREMTGVALAAGVVLSTVTWLIAPSIVQAYASGLAPETAQLAELVLRSFAPLAFLVLSVAVLTTRLQAEQNHRYALAEGIPPLMVVVFLVSSPQPTILPLVAATLVGFACQAWWLRRQLGERTGIGVPSSLRLRSSQWPVVWRSASVMGAGQLAISFAQPVDQWFAASVGPGAIATLAFGNKIVALGMAVGATVISRATLPIFAEGFVRGDIPGARARARGWALTMLLAGVALAALGCLMAPWLVAVLFERGAFTSQDTGAVASALRWGLWQLPPYFAGLVMVAQLAGEGRYRTIASIAAVASGIKLTATYLLTPVLGLAGVIFATTLMYLSSAVMASLVLRGNEDGAREAPPRTRER